MLRAERGQLGDRYGSLPFELDADYNIARGIIEKIGVGKIVRRDKMPPSASDLIE